MPRRAAALISNAFSVLIAAFSGYDWRRANDEYRITDGFGGRDEIRFGMVEVESDYCSERASSLLRMLRMSTRVRVIARVIARVTARVNECVSARVSARVRQRLPFMGEDKRRQSARIHRFVKFALRRDLTGR